MRSLKAILLATVVGASLFCIASPAEARNRYWKRHWGWYNNTYRPYYYRNYGYGYRPGNYGYGYSRPYGYYGNYYGRNRIGVGGLGISIGGRWW